VIERAKGAVGRRLGLGEDEAYRRLREAASNANLKLIQVAKQVLEAEAMFHALEEADGRPHGGPGRPAHPRRVADGEARGE
jgi:hypothetical protein